MRFFTKAPIAMSLLVCLFVLGCSSADDPPPDDPPPPSSEWGTMKWGESSWNNE